MYNRIQGKILAPDKIKCRFCSDLKGIITHTSIGWAHNTCVNWLPEMWYVDIVDDFNKKIVKGDVKGSIDAHR